MGILKYLCTKFQIISLWPFSTLQEGQGNHKLGLGGAILVFHFASGCKETGAGLADPVQNLCTVAGRKLF